MITAIVIAAIVIAFIIWMCFEIKNAPTVKMDGTIQWKKEERD